jgi:hypothetical protein
MAEELSQERQGARAEPLKSDAEGEPVKIKEEDSPDKLAGWVIGPYLVVHIVLLSILALLTWIAPDWANFVRMIPLLPSGLESIGQYIQDDKFHIFQNVVLAACAAGLGGAVFMVREFYLNFAYGRTSARQPVSYLKNKEIPRYILLPFSSVVLGPIALSLLLAGSIVFVGFSAGEEVPHFSAVAVSFLLGFTYHDTLKALRKLSRRLFDRKPDDGNPLDTWDTA